MPGPPACDAYGSATFILRNALGAVPSPGMTVKENKPPPEGGDEIHNDYTIAEVLLLCDHLPRKRGNGIDQFSSSRDIGQDIPFGHLIGVIIVACLTQ